MLLLFVYSYPVPISLNPSYLFLGSNVETGSFGSAFLIRLSNSFSVRIKGGNWGISVQSPAGLQGCFDICFCKFKVRSLYVLSVIGSGFKKQSLPNTLGIS